ncbi:MAG: hypothetical protein H7174_09840 [Flavobacterium sp.]|nr:hypothetical protein [Flavobacterium sp.]
MKISEFKNKLENLKTLDFYLPNGNKIPSHFHITEVGMITKNFTDCGNTFRIEKKANLQIWTSVDYWHRLDPKMIISIVNGVEKNFNGEDLELQIEYQQETIGVFELSFTENKFQLINTKTDCLAKNSCEFPIKKVKIKLKDLQEQIASCCETNTESF